MKVLVACEFSRTVADAFEKKGHDVTSCDFLPAKKPGKHYQGNVYDILYNKWDLLIGHPTCTRICNSGVMWLDRRNLWEDMYKACDFFRDLMNADIPKICIENPIPHKYALKEIGRKYDQIIQPWQFGHGETKATCLWLAGLPPLQPTNIVDGRVARVHRMPAGPNRWRERSRTFEGIAWAMALQWGCLADEMREAE